MVDLGAYAGPVLLAYGVTFVLLAGVIVASIARARRIKSELAELERDDA